jgi:outer membrane protein assembly factor BamB|tara:strand:+ start:78 stop:1376 length:1299 start_codon:yes stop_codon:yes gene_type:complete
VNKVFVLILIPFFLYSCSLNSNSKIWNKEQNKLEKSKDFKKIDFEEKKEVTELNSSIKINFSNIQLNENSLNDQNNFGSLKYLGMLEKVGSFKFSKFKDINNLNFKPLFLENGLVFFDKKGSIIRYDENSKIIWKKNYYSKSEKKLSPKLSFYKEKENIYIIDTIGKIYSIDILNGDLNWKNNNNYPFNSEIKISQEKLFAVDYNNILRCFNKKDGSQCWKYQTETSLTLSNTKYSIILYKNNVIFSNSLGDVTSIDISSGTVNWQIPTQSNLILNQSYNFKNSRLVGDDNSIYFSNNQNQFYSIDIKNGFINWMNQINSSLTPILIQDTIFTISDEGYLYTLQKKEGNIIRINDIYEIYKPKERKKIKPIGFKIGNEKLYLTNNDGKILVVDLSTGKVVKTQKISRETISKPFINNENLYIIKNGSIIKFN